jgi:hypothetical protein
MMLVNYDRPGLVILAGKILRAAGPGEDPAQGRFAARCDRGRVVQGIPSPVRLADLDALLKRFFVFFVLFVVNLTPKNSAPERPARRRR